MPWRIPNVAIHDALIWGGCAIVVLVVVIALAGRTAPTWPLAVTALTFSALRAAWHATRPRLAGPMLRPAVSACGRRRADRRFATGRCRVVDPGHGARLLLAVVVGFSYRVINNRSESPPWTAAVAAATHECQKPGMGDYDYRHAWWLPQIPCSRV